MRDSSTTVTSFESRLGRPYEHATAPGPTDDDGGFWHLAGRPTIDRQR